MNMADNVEIPFGDDPGVTAQGLLAAAERLKGFEQADVKTTSFGTFSVPQEVADEAESYAKGEDKAPAKKTAKKAAAKKATKNSGSTKGSDNTEDQE